MTCSVCWIRLLVYSVSKMNITLCTVTAHMKEYIVYSFARADRIHTCCTYLQRMTVL